jgi:uncharacterized membrane-anchored protein YhcB (DUF1043 family)
MSNIPPNPPGGAVPPPPQAPQQFPQQQYSAPPPRNRAGMWIALAAVIALVVGVGVGMLAAQPSKNDVADQRDAARSQATELQKELSASQSSSSASSGARDKCSKAATDAKDLIIQHENLWSDFDTYMGTPSNSAAEEEMVQHMNTQQQTMTAQRDVVNEELSACRNALG